MEVTEVRVKLMYAKDEKLKAFCTLTFDNEFVIREVKIIEGPHGIFIAMPSRKVTDHCLKCGHKNHLKAHFCSGCGARLDPNRLRRFRRGPSRLHTDIAHPINAGCRSKIEKRVIGEFEAELKRSKEPGYVPPSLDDDGYEEDFENDPGVESPAQRGDGGAREEEEPDPAHRRAVVKPARDGDSDADPFTKGIY